MSLMELLQKFKQKARLVEPTQSKELDFPFTKLQLKIFDTEAKINDFFNNILLRAESMAKKTFANPDEDLILFFMAYFFVYEVQRSNFRHPHFFEIPALDQDVPDEIHQIKNDHIRFGMYESAKNVKSNAAFFFCYEFAKDLGENDYLLAKSDFKVEDLLAKISAPFLIQDVEDCKKFMVFDGRRPASEPRLFLLDVNNGHIEALKIKNPIGTSYEYDENFLAYGRVRVAFSSAVLIGKNIHISRKVVEADKNALIQSHFIDIQAIETDSEKIDEKILSCEKFIFI